MSLIYGFNFHPVGQGLFASGSIHVMNNHSSSFHWVYDCGTMSDRKNKLHLISNGIAKIKLCMGEKNKLDLVTLSHFDQDHINGLMELLEHFTVGTLMLPYIPLRQRLYFAFEEGLAPTDPFFLFFINPVEFLFSPDRNKNDRIRIDRILFVLPSGRVGPKSRMEGDVANQEDNTEDFTLRYYTPDSDDEDKHYLTDSFRSKVEFLKPGSALMIGTSWEFVPYNDQKLAPKVNRVFVQNVEEKKRELLSGGISRKEKLEDLKDLYDRKFGKSSKKRNLISLFLYGGPIMSDWYEAKIRESASAHGCIHDHLCFRHLLHTHGNCRIMCIYGSVLFTGDGFLDNCEKRLKPLLDFLGKPRIKRIGVFQVMHHGSKSNWQLGVAAAFSPVMSVFCSERERYGHPHDDVQQDFREYGPIRVDKEWGATAVCFQHEKKP